MVGYPKYSYKSGNANISGKTHVKTRTDKKSNIIKGYFSFIATETTGYLSRFSLQMNFYKNYMLCYNRLSV